MRLDSDCSSTNGGSEAQVISAQVLSTTTLSIGWLGYVPLLLWAGARTGWVELFADSRRQHLLFGTIFALFALWLVRRDFDTGVSYHIIGMTAVTLLLDWPLAILGGCLAQLGLLALGRLDLAAIGINGLLLVGLPVLVTEACAAAVERAQPRNLFVYIFCSGFFAAALTALLCLLLGLVVLWWDGRFAMPQWLGDFVGYLWLIVFPEAFINGTVVSALVVYCPDWLETFNRTRYLQAPWKDDEP
ncbi:hypothetical protein G7009_12545 [Pseudomonas capeferrum]|uniref:energy-coupling factor ABC transporter permease n=1 Tax=Pseudomonas capeferrum TaxID=1495066 RepID=UPI0015E47919|nr:energy-coupling factor ABC transporter permease [Pseudomonas capeferrum]MBA1202577.1 hypothetical protein [Pseudomonas capeferrum]